MHPQRVSAIDQRLQPARLQRVVFRTGLAVMFGAVLAAVFVPWQQTSEGYGRVVALRPGERIQPINTVVSGRITEWFVQDGQSVQAGDPIVKIQDIDPLYVQRLEQEIAAKERKVSLLTIAAETARKNWTRQQRLVADGLSAQRDAEKAKIEYKKLASDLQTNQAVLLKAQSKLSREQVRTVTAPADGTILQIMEGGLGGVVVKEGAKIATFEPRSQVLSAEIYIDGNDLSLIVPGRPVRLQFEGWPALQAQGWPALAIGTFDGVVHAVDSSSVRGGKYRVLVKHDPDSDQPWPDTRFLRQGTAVHAWVQLDVVRLGYEIWRKINDFPVGTIQISTDTKGSKKETSSGAKK